jgi:predicted nucleic acid-binding protein
LTVVVVDSSVIVAALSPDEKSDKALLDLRAAAAQGMLAPSLLMYELANVIVTKRRRGGLDADDHARLNAEVANLPVELIELNGADSADLAVLALDLNLSAYDAAYVQLARQRSASLLTLDRRLAEAARAAGVALI